MKKQTEFETAKELWEDYNKNIANIFQIKKIHLQTCERWFEFLFIETSDVEPSNFMQDKIKDLEQAIKYHKSKLGENGK